MQCMYFSLGSIHQYSISNNSFLYYIEVPWLLTSAYFALFTGCEIGKDGWGSIRFGGGRGEGDGKKEVDAENKAEDVTSPLELAEPIDPKMMWNKC